jgi:hypothetical protein
VLAHPTCGLKAKPVANHENTRPKDNLAVFIFEISIAPRRPAQKLIQKLHHQKHNWHCPLLLKCFLHCDDSLVS